MPFLFMLLIGIVVFAVSILTEAKTQAQQAGRPNLLFTDPGAEQQTHAGGYRGTVASDLGFQGEPWITKARVVSGAISLIALVLVLVYLAPGSTSALVISDRIVSSPVLFTLLGALMFVGAALLGIYRQLNTKLMNSAFCMQAARADGHYYLMYLGDTPNYAWQYSGLHRGVTFAVVALLACLAGLTLSSTFGHLTGADPGLVFWALLGLRWFVSFIPQKLWI